MTDKDIEKEIQAKGLTAPRITPEHLETVIVSEQYYVFPNTTFTACLLTLVNGYTVLGESACARRIRVSISVILRVDIFCMDIES